MSQKIIGIIKSLIIVLMIIFTAILAVSSTGFVYPDSVLSSHAFITPMLLIIGVFFFALLLKGAWVFISNSGGIRLRVIFWTLIAVFIAACVFMLLNFRVLAITDLYVTEDQALALARGDYDVITAQSPYGYYFAKYSNNYFLLTLFTLIYKGLLALGINDFLTPLFILNALSMFAGVLFSYAAVKKLSGREKACMTLLICVLNPVPYLLIFWPYTATLSMSLIMGVVYFSVCILKSESAAKTVLYSVLLAVFGVLGYYMRPTSVIPMIAFVICLVLGLRLKKEAVKKTAAAFLTTAVVFLTLFAALGSVVRTYVDIPKDSNFPPTHWVMMGLGEKGIFNSNDENYTQSFNTYDKKIKGNIDEISRRINRLGFSGSLKHFVEKLEYSWNDGTSESALRLTQDTKFSKFYPFFTKEKGDFLYLYCQVYRILSYVFIAASLVKQLKDKNKGGINLLFTLSLLGGMVFYIIWEAKQIYCVPFLYIMGILAADGAYALFPAAAAAADKTKTGSVVLTKVLPLTLTALTAFSMIYLKNDFTEKEFNFTDRSVYCYTNMITRTLNTLSRSNSSLTQEFYSEKKFNTLRLKAKPLNTNPKTRYSLDIINQDGKILYHKIIGLNDITEDGYIDLKFKEIKPDKPDKKEKYIIRIKGTGKRRKDSIAWTYRKSEGLDNYDGVCVINGKTQNFDMFIRVYNEYRSAYITKISYFSLCFAVILIQFCAILIMRRNFGLPRLTTGQAP